MKPYPLRVLHMIDGLQVGGAEVVLCQLLRGLQGRHYHVSVCYSTPGPLQAEVAALGVPLARLPRLARVDPLLIIGLCRVIRRNQPQIVHTHLFKSDFHGRLAARLCGVPVVVSTLHARDAWAKQPLLGRLYGATAHFADQLIAVSEEVRQYAITHTRVPAIKICTIENGVEVARFKEKEAAGQALRQQLGIAADTPLVGIVGRLAPQKDHATFLRAAALIFQELPQARFLIVGDGPLRKTLMAQTSALRMNQAVMFCGMRNDIPAVMAAIDLLVLSSPSEGLPITLLEGMAAARPVVATAVGGIPGVVVEGHTGLLVPPGDPASLARESMRILQEPALGKRMGQAGRARVEAHYSIEAMTHRTAQLYEELLSRRGLRRTVQQGPVTPNKG